MTTLGAAATRGATLTLTTQGFRFVLQIATLSVLARLLDPADFGLVAMVTAITNSAEIVRDLGLSSAVLQARTMSDGERSNLFWLNVAIGGSCTVIALACSGLVADLYGQPEVQSIMVALSCLFVVSGANTQFRAELGRTLRFRSLALTDVVAQVTASVSAITAAVLGAGYWTMVVQQAVLVTVTLLMNVAACEWRPGGPTRGAPIGRFVRFGASVLGTQSLGYVTNNVDNVAVGIASGTAPLGLYSRAYQLLLVPINQIVAPMSRVVLPVLSRVQDDQDRYVKFVLRTQMMGCYVIGTPMAIAAGASVPIVAILFGDGWSGVAPIFAILAIGGVARGAATTSYWIYLSRGRPGAQLKMYLVLRPIMIAVILCGVPWGPVGVAWGHTVAFSLNWVVALWHSCRITGLPSGPLFRRAIRSIVVVSAPAGVLAFVGARVVDNSVLGLAAASALSVGYLVAVFALSPVERGDLVEFRSMVRRRRTPDLPAGVQPATLPEATMD